MTPLAPRHSRLLGRRPFLLGLAAGAAVLAGCSPARLLDAVTPEGDYRREPDLAYGPHPRQRLDLYRPAAGEPAAVVVFFYGGSWRSGRKADYRFVAESLTRQGLTVVIPDYRLVPEVRFPDFVHDGARAVRWTRERFGPAVAVHLMGHSAGAHIAALLALDDRYLGAVGESPAGLAGLVGIAGPYDFLPIASRRVAEVFAGTPDLAATQPLTYADRPAPPSLLLHGAEDRVVHPRNAERLAAALRQAGNRVTLALYPALGHADILLGLSSVLAGDGRVAGDILAFLRPADVAGFSGAGRLA